MDNQSRRSNASGNVFDSCRAVVVDNKHHKGWHKAKVRLLVGNEGIPERELPWAEYLLPLGARANEGEFMPVQPGDLVWVDFPVSGDTRYPRIIGSVYSVDGKGTGKSLLPQDGFKPTYNHKRTEKQPPAPQAQYGDKVLDLFGVLQQLTQNSEWCLTHKASGTALEIDGDGNVILHTEGNRFDSATDNHIIEVGEDLRTTVKGHQKTDIDKTLNITVKGTADIKADSIHLNDGDGQQRASRSCDFCLIAGVPHEQGSETVFIGD